MESGATRPLHCARATHFEREQFTETRFFKEMCGGVKTDRLASGTFVSTAIADETVKSDMSHADTYVKDSVITTKVKANLAEKHVSTLTNIQVDTDSHGIVWLSGNA